MCVLDLFVEGKYWGFIFLSLLLDLVRTISALTKYSRAFCAHVLVFLLVFYSAATSMASPEDPFRPGEAGVPGYPQEGTFFFHQDVLDSTVLLTDKDGKQAAKIAYTPYGDIDLDNSEGLDIFREKYTGQEFDVDTGLYYYGARYYDPELGIFITPEQDQEFFNPYLYAGNDPASASDEGGRAYGSKTLIASIKAIDALFFVGSMFTTAAQVNGTFNPINWDWSLGGGTYAGLMIGALVGYVAGSLGAELEGYSTGPSMLANVAGMRPQNTALTTMSGGSKKAIVGSSSDNAIGAPVGSAGKAISSGKVSINQAGPASIGEDVGECQTRGSSFPAGTLIAVKDKLVPIETIKLGDQVWAYNEKENKAELAKVEGTFSRFAQQIVEIKLINSETVQATPEHPFWVEGKGWVKAEHLKADYEFKTLYNTKIKVIKVSYTPKSTPVYNFNVAQLHNYFVGQAKSLVHNMEDQFCTASRITSAANKLTGKVSFPPLISVLVDGDPRMQGTSVHASTPGNDSRTEYIEPNHFGAIVVGALEAGIDIDNINRTIMDMQRPHTHGEGKNISGLESGVIVRRPGGSISANKPFCLGCSPIFGDVATYNNRHPHQALSYNPFEDPHRLTKGGDTIVQVYDVYDNFIGPPVHTSRRR